MGFKFGTRINLGKGLGIHVSKAGITPSLRTKAGTLSTKGFSVKTGIRGVSYRNAFGKSSGCMAVILCGISISISIIKLLLN